MRTLRDIDVEDKIVLVRTDYNVPLELDDAGEWQVASDLRIRASLPTLRYLREHGAKKIILISHLGRPKGKDPALSLAPVAERLAWLLAQEGSAGSDSSMVPPTVDFVDHLDVKGVKSAIEQLPKGGIILLENLRFDPREKANDVNLARELIDATGAEIFVQDGFAVTHRAHTSTDALARLLPSAAGLLVEKEVAGLSQAIRNPEHPFVIIIGGAKAEDKQPLIDEFKVPADQILVGGKIAADGYKTDDPKVYVAEDFDEDADGNRLDIGPLATAKFLEVLGTAKTVLWNGVLGKTEDPAFATSSEMVAKYLGGHHEMETIICGGDTTGFVESLVEKYPNLRFSLISTGGGAALEFLLGNKMPGIEVLE